MLVKYFFNQRNFFTDDVIAIPIKITFADFQKVERPTRTIDVGNEKARYFLYRNVNRKMEEKSVRPFVSPLQTNLQLRKCEDEVQKYCGYKEQVGTVKGKYNVEGFLTAHVASHSYSNIIPIFSTCFSPVIFSS